MSDHRLSRRDLTLGALALAVLPACGGPVSAAIDAGPACGSDHGTEAEGWIAIPLAEHPELRSVGGSAVVRDSPHLLQAIVRQPSEGCFKAVWEICPHGSCEVGWQPQQGLLECPCHGSQFSEDGDLLRGPATRGLTSFAVVQEGDTLWLKRR